MGRDRLSSTFLIKGEKRESLKVAESKFMRRGKEKRSFFSILTRTREICFLLLLKKTMLTLVRHHQESIMIQVKGSGAKKHDFLWLESRWLFLPHFPTRADSPLGGRARNDSVLVLFSMVPCLARSCIFLVCIWVPLLLFPSRRHCAPVLDRCQYQRSSLT